jgi:hypothetical protein
MLKSAESFANTAKAVADSIGGFADTFPKILDWVGIANVSIEGFVYNITVLLENFYNSSVGFSTGMTTSVKNFTDAVSAVAGTLESSVSGLNAIRNFAVVDAKKITDFTDNLKVIVDAFKAAVDGPFKTNMYAGALAFAEIAGKAVEIIGNGVEGFTKLATFHAVSAEKIHLFVDALSTVVGEFKAAVGSDFKAGMYDAAKAFADAAGPVLTAVGTAADTFSKMVIIITPAKANINAFIDNIYAIMDSLKTKLGQS